MAVELAMEQFVGAGLSIWASGLGLIVPNGAISNSAQLVDGLICAHRQETHDLIAKLKSGIWSDLSQTNISMDAAEQHLGALPELLECVRPDPDLLRSAIVQAEIEQFADGDVSDIARFLSTELASMVRESPYSKDPRYQSPLSFVLVEWLFSSLLLNRQAIAELRPEMDQILRSYVEQETPDVAKYDGTIGSENADPKRQDDECTTWSDVTVQLGETTGLEREAIDGLIEIGAYDLSAITHMPAQLKVHADSCRAFIDQLQLIGEAMGMDDVLCDALHRTATAMACGDFTLAGEELRKAEFITASKLPRSTDGREQRALGQTYEYLTLKTLRAKYYEIVRVWREAAVQYQSASSLLPVDARYERWRLMTKCAEALSQLGKAQSGTDTLIEATQVYAEAGGLLSEADNPIEWAGVHLDIGSLLLLLGKRERRPVRFLAAILHFKPAADVLLKEASHKTWAKAQLLLAQALKAQGEVQGDVVTLGEAASCFRNSIKRLTREHDFELWTQAQCGLGATLQRICEETDDVSDLAEAMEALETILELSAYIDPHVVAEAEAAMAGAKIQLALASSDESHLETAIQLLKSARDVMSDAARTSNLAEIERKLGLAIWNLVRAGGRDETDMDLAISAFESAAGHYASQGDEANAEAMHERAVELKRGTMRESLPAA